MACHRSGLDHLRVLMRSAITDPKPEPKPEPARPKKLTRREKRALARDWTPRAASLTAEERRFLKQHGVVLEQCDDPEAEGLRRLAERPE